MAQKGAPGPAPARKPGFADLAGGIGWGPPVGNQMFCCFGSGFQGTWVCKCLPHHASAHNSFCKCRFAYLFITYGLKSLQLWFCTMACKSLLTANGLVRLQVMIVLQQGLYLLPHHNSTDAFASNDFLQHGLRVFVHYKRSFVFARNGFLRQGLHLLARKYKITRRRLVDSRTLPQSYQQHDF